MNTVSTLINQLVEQRLDNTEQDRTQENKEVMTFNVVMDMLFDMMKFTEKFDDKDLFDGALHMARVYYEDNVAWRRGDFAPQYPPPIE